MVRLDAFIFGYRIVRVEKESTAKVINILLKLGISSDVRGEGEIIIGERDVKRFSEYCAGRIRYTMSETRGLMGALCRMRERRGLTLAVILVMLLHVWLSGTVWDVRVDGNERISDGEICAMLSECGFEIGARWHRVDKNAVETELLSEFPDVSWISINRRGTVAYVKVMESENIGKTQEDAPKYSNILADRDAVIEEITVAHGSAAVKVGDVVRKGDVLISGIIETEGGTVFCRAEGSVIGQSVGRVSAEITKGGIEKTYKEKSVYEIKLKIFNFSINIFKNYGICENSYDIIKDEREYALFGKYRLPVTLVKTYRSEYTEKSVTYTESEIIEMARAKLNSEIRERFSSCDVIKMRSFGGWELDSYVLTTELVYLTDITLESAIEVS